MLILAFVLLKQTASAGIILAWHFDDIPTGGEVPATWESGSSEEGILQSTLTRGAGVADTAFPYPLSAADTFRAFFGWDGIEASIETESYFEWTVAAEDGYTLSLTSIEAGFRGVGAYAAPMTMVYAYSLDDGDTFTYLDEFQLSGANPGRYDYVFTGSDLENLSDLESVIFRFYASGVDNSSGPPGYYSGWGFYGPTNGLQINGTVTTAAIPEPTKTMLLVFAIGATLLRRRRTLS